MACLVCTFVDLGTGDSSRLALAMWGWTDFAQAARNRCAVCLRGRPLHAGRGRSGHPSARTGVARGCIDGFATVSTDRSGPDPTCADQYRPDTGAFPAQHGTPAFALAEILVALVAPRRNDPALLARWTSGPPSFAQNSQLLIIALERPRKHS